MEARLVTERILGLDLSLRGCGMVALPLLWGGDWNRVVTHTFGEPLGKDASEALRIGRLVRIAATVIEFGRRNGCSSAIIEGYSFASRQSHAHSLGELGGVVRHQLVEKLGLCAASVSIHSARKLLMGKAPMKDAKIAARSFLTSLGMPPSWSMDAGDAFVVANFAASALGGYALVVEPPVEEKPKRARRAA